MGSSGEIEKAIAALNRRKEEVGVTSIDTGGDVGEDAWAIYLDGMGLDEEELARAKKAIGVGIVEAQEHLQPMDIALGSWFDGLMVGMLLEKARRNKAEIIIGSALAHAQEGLGAGGEPADIAAFTGLMGHPDIEPMMRRLADQGLLPVKR
jgi:hypothetical protein